MSDDYDPLLNSEVEKLVQYHGERLHWTEEDCAEIRKLNKPRDIRNAGRTATVRGIGRVLCERGWVESGVFDGEETRYFDRRDVNSERIWRLRITTDSIHDAKLPHDIAIVMNDWWFDRWRNDPHAWTTMHYLREIDYLMSRVNHAPLEHALRWLTERM